MNRSSKPSFSYVKEKYFEAVRILATYPGNVKSRLGFVCSQLLRAPTASLPLEFRKKAERINDSLTRKKPKNYQEKRQGAVSLTLHRMRFKTAEEIAESIFNLHCEMQSRL